MKQHIDDKTKKDDGAENSVWVLQDSYLNGHTGAIYSVAAKGEIIASASSDNTVRFWDKNSLEEVMTLYGHSNSVSSVAILDENRVIGGLDGEAIKMCNIKMWITPPFVVAGIFISL